MSFLRSISSIAILLLGCGAAVAASPDKASLELERRFESTIRPFIGTYCLDCHGAEKPKGDFDLSPFNDVRAVARDHLQWGMVLEKLQSGEMPPKKAKQRPTAAQGQGIAAWILELRRHEAEKNAGDPGPVLARRLSNTEYDRTIRDLTGVDLRPTKEFPVDPANQEGFDNTGESLVMSPALLKKYLGAARVVSEHAVLNLDGIAFASHPMMSIQIATNTALYGSSTSTNASPRILRTTSPPRGASRTARPSASLGHRSTTSRPGRRSVRNTCRPSGTR